MDSRWDNAVRWVMYALIVFNALGCVHYLMQTRWQDAILTAMSIAQCACVILLLNEFKQ